MRVFVVTSGSHGDVHPFLAIGRELLARGHDVIFFTHDYFRPEVETAGIKLVPICMEIDMATTLRDPELMHPTRGGPKALRMVLEGVPSAVSTIRRGLEECPPDVVVRSSDLLRSQMAVRRIPDTMGHGHPFTAALVLTWRLGRG